MILDHSTELRHVPHNQPHNDYCVTIARMHVPSGKTWRERKTFLCRRHMLELLDVWNGQQPGAWQYWSQENNDAD